MANLLFASKINLPIEFAQLFKEAGYNLLMQVRSASEARRIINEKEVNLVVINAPLTDEFGHELALSIEEMAITNVVMLVSVNVVDAIEQKMEGTSVIVLPNPVSKVQLYKTLTFLKAQSAKISRVIDENHKLQEKLEELKLISRAKMLLIEHNNMSEEGAHKHIDKTAKGQRRTKKEVAMSIIQLYN